MISFSVAKPYILTGVPFSVCNPAETQPAESASRNPTKEHSATPRTDAEALSPSFFYLIPYLINQFSLDFGNLTTSLTVKNGAVSEFFFLFLLHQNT